MPLVARELDYTTPREVDSPEYEFPFEKNGDFTSTIIRRRYKQTRSAFTASRPLPGGVVTDPEIPSAYFMGMDNPSPTPTGLVSYRRTFATIPADQVTYGTRVITKPVFPTNDYAGAYVDSTSATTTANVWSVAIATTMSAYATGGTFTITYKTSTTGALAYNASNASIATAINALANVVTDAFTVSADNLLLTQGQLRLALATGAIYSNNDFSWTPSLTPTMVTGKTFGGINASEFYATRASINFNKTAHGLVVGQSIRLITASTGGGYIDTVESVVDSDNFTIDNASANFTAVLTYYRTLLRTYTPGTDRVRIRRTQSFYLPGITAGITTAQDIPTPDVLLNDGVLLTAIATATAGYSTYDASELTRWNEWPIYTQTIEAIDLDTL